MISQIMGRALAWATDEWARVSVIYNSFQSFSDFHHTTPGREAARALVELKQQQRCVSDYATEFCTLAAYSGWNDSALLDAFLHGLSDPIMDQLGPFGHSPDLDAVIAMATQINNRICDRIRDQGSPA